MSQACQKCGSDKIVPKATIWDRGQSAHTGNRSLLAYVYAKPDAILFGDPAYAALFARICGDCGFTEIYADGAVELYEAYRRGLRLPPTEPESPPAREGDCLSCGEPIPPSARACPACGWTWNASHGANQTKP